MILFNKKLGIKYNTDEEIDRILNKFTPTVSGRGKRKYLNIASALDIETTNFKYNDKKLSLMYHHQIGLLYNETGFVYCLVGRTDDELKHIINKLNEYAKSKKAKLIVYVQNLSFEYFFMRGLFDFDDYFVTRQNSILYAIYGNIEFRCSYLLSGCSLSTLTDFMPKEKNLIKLVDDLDYKVLRTPKSSLSDLETAYCLNDVRIVCKYIQYQMDTWGNMYEVPLTKTSGSTKKMRLYCMPKGKDTMSMIQKKRFIREISQLKFHSSGELYCATETFMGGHTNANPFKVNKILENVFAWDFISSYSAVCCYSAEFPKSYIGHYKDKGRDFLDDEINLNHAFICKLTLTNVKPAIYLLPSGKEIESIWDSFIPYDKCENIENAKTDKTNGKVITADKLTIYCTNLDYEVYKRFYKFDVHVDHIYTYTKGYLPRPVIEFILNLYKEKTKLKNVEGKEIQYNLSKEDLNACSYGVHVKSILQEVLQFNEEEEKWLETFKGEWLKDVYDLRTTEDQKKYYLEKTINYNRRIFSGQVIIPYIAALFIPSIAKKNIAFAIRRAGLDDMYCYSDTDSIYEQGNFKPYIDKYNSRVKEQFEAMCKFYGFNSDVWRPKNAKGDEKPLGYFALDGHYKYMKILRPKTYITIDYNDELHTTIAGLGKNEGAKFLADFDETHEEYTDDNGIKHYIVHDYKKVMDAFKIGLKIPADKTGELHHKIFRDHHEGDIVDYEGNNYHFNVNGGVYLEDEEFEIKNDSKWEKLLNLYVQGQNQIYYK